MNDIAVRQNTSIATATGRNAFEAYSEAVNTNRIVGNLLKFNKGDWLVGQNADELEKGTEVIAAIHELMVGWLKWSDKKVIDMRMGRVADGYMPEIRNALGDTDKSLWDTDDDGRPQDPWQMTSYLICKAKDDDTLYTYAPSSSGGRNAVATLAGLYGKRSRQNPDEIPVVSLQVDSYQHKVYGRTKVPVLRVVGWTSKAATMAAIAGEAAEAEAAAGEKAEAEGAGDVPYKASAAPKKAAKPGAETKF